MSTYPSTADLAAFRRAIRPDLDDIHPDASPDMAAYHGIAAAWSAELRDGIGYQRTIGWWADGMDGARARREASAMRTRAYRRQPCGDAITGQPPGAEPITCQRHADHTGSHAARLPGAWQWWNRDGSRRDVEIPAAAYVRGGRPSDWIEPR